MSAEPASEAEVYALFAAAQGGDRHALARALSLLENDSSSSRLLDQRALAAPVAGLVVGITGAPGAGKSSLVDLLIGESIAGGPVAVVAIDPSSPFSHGAILGDRVRMSSHGYDENVFIRSLASRGAPGGLSLASRRTVRFLLACGYKTVFLETAGVGQIELDIAGAADEVVVVLTPNSGDEIQAAKAGILEIADVFAVNKADLPGVDSVIRNLSYELSLSGSEEAPSIVSTSATTGQGVAELWSEIAEVGESRMNSGAIASRRAEQRIEELAQRASEQLKNQLQATLDAEIADRVRAGTLDPATGAELLVSDLLKERV